LDFWCRSGQGFPSFRSPLGAYARTK